MVLGKTNKLKIYRSTDQGYYLIDEENNEVLLPNVYSSEEMKIDDYLEVFVYKDSQGRLTATTLVPKAEVDHFAYLEVKQITKVGAFMDWGIAKDLLVPFAEQTEEMKVGEKYLVFIFEDEFTDRIVGSCKENDFVYFDEIDLEVNQKVSVLPYRKSHLGMNVIIENQYKGLIHNSDIHRGIELGISIFGFVKNIREDGKLDITLEAQGYRNSIDEHRSSVLDYIKKSNGTIYITDKSSPEMIKEALGMSKKAFKKAIGNLYKSKKIDILEDRIIIVKS